MAYVKEVMDIPAPRDQIKLSRALSLTPQAAEIDLILKQKVYHFSIFCFFSSIKLSYSLKGSTFFPHTLITF